MHERTYVKRFMRSAIIVVIATTVVLVGALAARGGQPTIAVTAPLLAPNPVTSGLDTLYSTSYENTGGNTLTNASILVTLPAGSQFRFADPAVCTAAEPAGDGTILVTCPRGLMPPGQKFTQQIVFLAPTATGSETSMSVSSRLIFNERDSDGDTGKQHTDTVCYDDPNDDVVGCTPTVTNIHPVSRDLLGKCASKDGETLSTDGAATSKTNPQITAATVPPNATLACSPVVVREVSSAGVAGVCPTTCQTQISITDSPQFSLASPVLLTFKIDGSLFGKAPDPATFKWYKEGTLVPDCDPLQPLLDPCVATRGKNGAKGVTLGVRWSGNDPSWGG